MWRNKDYDDYDDYDDYGYKSYWKADEKSIKRDFMNYCNKERKIDEEGYEKMGKTLGIDIYNDIFITYFVYKCKSETLEFITEEQYMEGMKAFKCNSLNEVKNKILSTREKLLEIHNDDFCNFYNFLFDLNVPGKESKEKKSKLLGYDEVEVYFNQLFCDQFPFCKEFLVYLKEKRQKNPGMKWDEWGTFLDFLRKKGSQFPKDYNVSDHYPILIDDFYYWYCKKHNLPIPSEEEEEEV